MCIADPERTAIHTNPERRGRTCENSRVIDGMVEVILRLIKVHQSVLAAEEESGLQQAQQAAAVLRENAKQRKRYHYQESNWTKRW